MYVDRVANKEMARMDEAFLVRILSVSVLDRGGMHLLGLHLAVMR